MTKDIKSPEEIKEEHNEKLFRSVYIRNIKTATVDSLKIHAVIKKTNTARLMAKILDDYVKDNSIFDNGKPSART